MGHLRSGFRTLQQLYCIAPLPSARAPALSMQSPLRCFPPSTTYLLPRTYSSPARRETQAWCYSVACPAALESPRTALAGSRYLTLSRSAPRYCRCMRSSCLSRLDHQRSLAEKHANTSIYGSWLPGSLSILELQQHCSCSSRALCLRPLCWDRLRYVPFSPVSSRARVAFISLHCCPIIHVSYPRGKINIYR